MGHATAHGARVALVEGGRPSRVGEEPDLLGLRLPLLRIVPDDEAHPGAGCDPTRPLGTLGDVEEEGLAFPVAYEAEALLREEAVDDTLVGARTTRIQVRMLQYGELGWEEGIGGRGPLGCDQQPRLAFRDRHVAGEQALDVL